MQIMRNFQEWIRKERNDKVLEILPKKNIYIYLMEFIPLITLMPKSQVVGKERSDFRGFISALHVLTDLISHGLGLNPNTKLGF